MNALNLPVKYPTEALPRWANRWAFDYSTNSITPVQYANGLVWFSSPSELGTLPQVPTGIILLDDPYTPIERFLYLASAACLLVAFIVNSSGCASRQATDHLPRQATGYPASEFQHQCIHGEIWAVNEHGRVNLGDECHE